MAVPQQHVNNAAYIRYAEASRVNWITHFASLDAARAAEWRSLMSPRDVGLIMKTIRADYKFVSDGRPRRYRVARRVILRPWGSRLSIPTASRFTTS